jgi:hypothetical protein
MASNTQIQIADLDFSSIKSNFINYLQKQDTFKDYNFTGSAMSVLLDVLAYNTQYNAYYLNMVANEMFLDSALQRSSVVSHAKLLNYVPKSANAPSAQLTLILNGVTTSSYTLPKFTNFMSEAINGVNYNFVTTDAYTVNINTGTASFINLPIKQGIPASYAYTVNGTTNPTYTFPGCVNVVVLSSVYENSATLIDIDLLQSYKLPVAFLNSESAPALLLANEIGPPCGNVIPPTFRL